MTWVPSMCRIAVDSLSRRSWACTLLACWSLDSSTYAGGLGRGEGGGSFNNHDGRKGDGAVRAASASSFEKKILPKPSQF